MNHHRPGPVRTIHLPLPRGSLVGLVLFGALGWTLLGLLVWSVHWRSATFRGGWLSGTTDATFGEQVVDSELEVGTPAAQVRVWAETQGFEVMKDDSEAIWLRGYGPHRVGCMSLWAIDVRLSAEGTISGPPAVTFGWRCL